VVGFRVSFFLSFGFWVDCFQGLEILEEGPGYILNKTQISDLWIGNTDTVVGFRVSFFLSFGLIVFRD